MPLMGALVIKEFQTWLRGRLTFAAFTLLVLLVSLLVFLLGMLILAPDANAAPALFSTTSTTSTNLLVANRAMLLLAVGVPFFAPAWSFGGVQPDQVIALVTILCTVTLFFSALGVFFGAILKGALQASLFAQGVALFIVFGTLGLHLAFVILSGNDIFRPLLWLNPFL